MLEGRLSFKSLTTVKNLTTGAIGRGLAHDQITQTLEQFYGYFPRIEPRRTLLTCLTSGGEQQMVVDRRGLMARPEAFLLDEPLMGLPPFVVVEIFEALAKLNRETGLTMLVAEQNSAIVLRYAHHATVIENGRSVRDGPPPILPPMPICANFILAAA